MVTSTCNPFFISLPMTSGDGNGWIYDVTVYPKNLTGDPTLDKTLRESKDDTGKHNGSASITDGYAATGTASDGDIVDYQIISTLPSITSASTYLTCYTFVDTLSKGITYNKNDVVLELFSDAACTDSIAKWTETDGKFTVTYSNVDTGESKMTIAMTADGLKEINTSKAVYAESSMVNSGYSDCTLRITYAATISSSADVVYGDNGNPNEVVLTWKRTSQDSYDTLKEIADWISSHKTDATAMNSAITALEGIVDGIGGTGEKATVVEYVTDAIAALKIGDYAKAADLTALAGRVTTLEGKAHTHANKALLDTYTQTEVDLADAVAKKHEHSNKTVLDGITSAKVAAWDKVSEKANNADLAAIAKTGNVNDLLQTSGDVLVFDCGSSSVNV